MFKNWKDLIKTREKLQKANLDLIQIKFDLEEAEENMKSYSNFINDYQSEIKSKEVQLAKLENTIANKKEILKGLNKKINPNLPTPKPAKKAIKKTK